MSNPEFDKPDWLTYGNPNGILQTVIWILWDCSTEWMVENGLPSALQVRGWIETLSQRYDVDHVDMRKAIATCGSYIAPSIPDPPRPKQHWGTVPVGTVLKVRKISQEM